MNSRDKGKRGERELAAFLRANGFDARRGQQFAGGADSPDIISELLKWLHIEVKRVERLNLIDACAQAEGDCGGKRWVVIHRRNHAPWLFTGRLDILLDFIRGVLPPAEAERQFGSFAPAHSAPVAPSPVGESISPLPKRLNSAAACVAAIPTTTNQTNRDAVERIPAKQQKEQTNEHDS